MKNRFIKKALAAVMALACCSSAAVYAADTDILAGDTDDNGMINTSDIVTLRNYLIAGGELSENGKKNADMNSDTEINVIDFILLKNLFMSNSSAPAQSTKITLDGTKITADEGVTVDGTKVTITKSGSYTVSGEMTADAQIIVSTAAEDTESVDLILDSVKMTNSTDLACIMIENAKKTKITLSGTSTLTNSYDAADAASAAIYAKDDITFTKSSSGTLEINTAAQMGVYCNNDIRFNGGKTIITTDSLKTETASADAVKAKGNVEITGGEINVNAAGDGIKSSKNAVVISGGVTVIKSGKDAVQGETAVTVTGGNTTASGDRGITSTDVFNLSGGTLLATWTDPMVFNKINFEVVPVTAALDEQHAKSEKITINEIEFTAAKKYQYILAYEPSFDNSKGNTVLIDGKPYEFGKSEGQFVSLKDLTHTSDTV